MASIFHTLMRQHRNVEALFERVRDECEHDPVRAATLLTMLRAALVAHARAEEAVVYPRFRQIGGLAGEIYEATAEHAAIEERLDELVTRGLDDVQFVPLLVEIEQMVKSHVAEEEGEVFRVAKIELDGDESERLADAFVAEYERQGGQRFELPSSKDADAISSANEPSYRRM